MSRYSKELIMAVNLVNTALDITEWFKNKGFNSYIKQDQSPVTIADFASQIFIISQLKSHFPTDTVIAEEEKSKFMDNNAKNLIVECFKELNIDNTLDFENIDYRGVSSDRQWTVDPIDGTIGFQKRLFYAIGVGLMVNSVPRICAIAVPNYSSKPKAIFSAEENRGAYISYGDHKFTPIKVSQIRELDKARFCHSLHYDQPWVLSIASELGIKNYIQLDSMIKFCMIAEGSADIYIKPLDENHSFSWDFLPGDLIVREAGGIVTDLKNNRLRFKQDKCIWKAPGIIASNKLLHEKVIEQLK
ncbi:MAG: inositol monophosphatase family protein [Promethearchaeota archaeon]